MDGPRPDMPGAAGLVRQKEFPTLVANSTAVSDPIA
jgi:hypothetical protein